MTSFIHENIAQSSSHAKKKNCSHLNFSPAFLYDEGLFKTKEQQRFLMTFYGGYAKASYKKLGESYVASKRVARDHIDQWIKFGFIEKTNNLYKPDLYIKSKGRHCLVQGENYYKLTQKGKAYRKDILNRVVHKCKDITKQGEIKFLEEVDKAKNIFENANSRTLNYPHYRSEEMSQEEKLRSLSSPALEWVIVGEDSQEAYEVTVNIFRVCVTKTKSKPLKRRKISETSHIAKESFRNTEKFRAIQEKFCQFGFKKLLNIAYRGTLLKLMTLSIEFIEKLLKLMRAKLKHKWKLRSFWGFFLSEVKKLPEKRRYAKPFFKMKAQECRDAVNGKKNRFSEGVDTNVITQDITKLERETGEIVSERDLARMFYHGTQKVKTAFDLVCYCSGLGKGDLPQEQAAQAEEAAQKPKKRPIFKMVKLKAKTKQPYSDEDFLSGEPFAMVNKIVGYETIKGKPQEKKAKISNRKRQTKTRSWIGMVFYTLNLGNCEVMLDSFFKKREATG